VGADFTFKASVEPDTARDVPYPFVGIASSTRVDREHERISEKGLASMCDQVPMVLGVADSHQAAIVNPMAEVGEITEIKADGDSLYISGGLDPDHPNAAFLYKKVKAGTAKLSIAGKVLAASRNVWDEDTQKNIAEIDEIKLDHILLCRQNAAVNQDSTIIAQADDGDWADAIFKAAAELEDVDKAVWSTAYINDLPDSHFLYIEPGGKKDAEGKTVPRRLRHFPYKDAQGNIDLPHLRNAIARAPQSNLPQSVIKRVQAKARRILAQQTSGKARETQGRMGGFGEGPGGVCVCPQCGYEETHTIGEPCYNLRCPECGAQMERKIERAIDDIMEAVTDVRGDGGRIVGYVVESIVERLSKGNEALSELPVDEGTTMAEDVVGRLTDLIETLVAGQAPPAESATEESVPEDAEKADPLPDVLEVLKQVGDTIKTLNERVSSLEQAEETAKAEESEDEEETTVEEEDTEGDGEQGSEDVNIDVGEALKTIVAAIAEIRTDVAATRDTVDAQAERITNLEKASPLSAQPTASKDTVETGAGESSTPVQDLLNRSNQWAR